MEANRAGSIMALISLGSRVAINLGSNPIPAAKAAVDVEIDEGMEDGGIAVAAFEVVGGALSIPETNLGSIPAAFKRLGSILAIAFKSKFPKPIMVRGSRPNILGSNEPKDLGSRPAAFKRLGSIAPIDLSICSFIPMACIIFGSRPKAAAALFKDDEGVEVRGAVTDEGTDVLGDRLSSLLTLALDGGLGEALGELEGPALVVVGLLLVVLVLALVPNNISIPGTPAIIEGLRP
jgi:hypothetical protein